MYLLSTAIAASVITNVLDLTTAIQREEADRTFDLTARINLPKSPNSPYLIMEDHTGAYFTYSSFTNMAAKDPHPGDIVRMQGRINIRRDEFGATSCNADCLELSVVARQQSPAPSPTTPGEIASGKYDYRCVILRGTILDAARQSIATNWYDLMLNCGGETIYMATCSPTNLTASLNALIGAEVEVAGVCHSDKDLMRGITGRICQIPSISSIRVLTPPRNRFDAPDLDTSSIHSPSQISRLGRVNAKGRAIAVRNRRLHVRLPDGNLLSVELMSDHAPSYGDAVEVVGFAETDTYQYILSRAIWRPCDAAKSLCLPTAVHHLHADDIVGDGQTAPNITIKWHGQLVSICGTVVAASQDGIIEVSDNGKLVRIDAGAISGSMALPLPDCHVKVVGTCIVNFEKWQPNLPFPHTTGFVIVPRSTADITVLAQPPWLTVGKLLVFVLVLLATIVGILIWNGFLRRLVDRRSRELLREEVGRIKATFRIEERTHLAVELHDALSQTLTGVALQIDAAERAQQKAPERLHLHLSTARRTLESCREELRNCLWDLRNQALEINDIGQAIRHTLAPHIGEAKLSVKFPVARSKLSDTTMHTILRILRELAVNAVRHGLATHISVVGSLDNDRLRLSVKDDGCGFDPEHSPGIEDGHFGLHGIGERIASMDGSFDISSAVGNGTKIEITIPAPRTADTD